MSKNESTLLEKLISTAQRYLACSIILLLSILMLRLYEVLLLFINYHFPVIIFRYEILGLIFDLYFFLKLSALLIVPFFLLYLIKPIIAEVSYLFVICFLVIAEMVLISYFGAAMVPLGSDLFAYSATEIEHTIGASGGITVGTYLSFINVIVLVVLFWKLLRKRNYSSWFFYPFYLATATTILLKDYSIPNAQNFKTDFNSYLVCNKLGFFTSKSFDYFDMMSETHRKSEKYSSNIIQLNKKASEYSFKYTNSEYLLMHIDETQDVLSPFFKQEKKQAPNFVFILVESLGRAYCGDNAYLGSFTPYLDSLMHQSLYWENFLSTGGRTFAVLPSIFGSLPFGERGFADMGEKMPKHLSLIKLLKEQGYQSSFIYGGDAHFDNMDIFLKRQGIDKIIDVNSFGAGYTKLPANDNGFSWGYGDNDIFKKLLEISSGNYEKPRIDIVLTIAMHDPFRVTNQAYYDKRFEERIKELKLNEAETKEHRMYKKNYATMLYFDDALRSLIHEYSKREDFKNTIFIITGDHRMPEIPISTQIDRFHVPLVIYSPMLQTAAKFSSISTQFDITPSITAFLHKNYNIQFPSIVPWIGFGLDTVRSFRNIHSYPLMRNKNEMLDYLDGVYFLSNNELYTIKQNLDIEPINNMVKLSEMQKKFANFKAVNSFIYATNHLITDSIYNLRY